MVELPVGCFLSEAALWTSGWLHAGHLSAVTAPLVCFSWFLSRMLLFCFCFFPHGPDREVVFYVFFFFFTRSGFVLGLVMGWLVGVGWLVGWLAGRIPGITHPHEDLSQPKPP